ncbi:hypothetical protein TSUD_320340 [Trifolium subterraneum]|uniref:Uncharacterized protein n=1 Tax=Trifolium subterraneum TaxID=3900 RepID=A0A2Z6MXB8_TRISU|nr:hypothetical protein TSUD_320340 [Trifolium subterraneum]
MSHPHRRTGNTSLTSVVILSSSSSQRSCYGRSDLTSTAILTSSSSRRNRSDRADLTSAAS